MKQYLFLTIIAFTLFTSCQNKKSEQKENTDPIQQQDEIIKFPRPAWYVVCNGGGGYYTSTQNLKDCFERGVKMVITGVTKPIGKSLNSDDDDGVDKNELKELIKLQNEKIVEMLGSWSTCDCGDGVKVHINVENNESVDCEKACMKVKEIMKEQGLEPLS